MTTRPFAQSGVSTLALVAVVLFVALMVAGYASLVLGLEQQSLQGVQRATQSRLLAQAGLDWGTALLNAPTRRNNRCQPDPDAAQSFRQGYTQTTSPQPEAVCELSSPLNCHCPKLAGGPAPSPVGPGFAVRFAPQPTTGRVRVLANACHSAQQACAVQDTGVLSVTLAAEPVLRHPLLAGLTCGGSCVVSGAVANTTPSSGGAIVVAGSTVTLEPEARLDGPPGSPAAAGLVAQYRDLAIRQAADPDCTRGLVFQAFFGLPPAAYALAPHVQRIACNTAADCSSRLQKAYQEGWRLFDFPSGLYLEATAGAAQWGTALSPIVVVTQGAVQFSGTHTLHGVLYLNRPVAAVTPDQPLSVEGAVMACGTLALGSRVTVTHQPDQVAEAANLSRRYVVVPGSWSDRP